MIEVMEVTSSDIYSIQDVFTGSSREEETDIEEQLDRVFSSWVNQFKKASLYQSLLPMLRTDASSIYPRFKLRSETSLVEELSEEDIIGEMIEHNLIVRMSPVKEYTVRATVRYIKGNLRVVEPTEI